MTVDRDETVEFARTWDQLSIHVDDDATNTAFADGGSPHLAFVVAVRVKLLHQTPRLTRRSEHADHLGASTVTSVAG